jgi:hypothetical protein
MNLFPSPTHIHTRTDRTSSESHARYIAQLPLSTRNLRALPNEKFTRVHSDKAHLSMALQSTRVGFGKRRAKPNALEVSMRLVTNKGQPRRYDDIRPRIVSR